MDINEVAKKILEGNEMILTTHQNPDGDGIGAVLALFLGLNKLNKDKMKLVRIVIEDPVPSFLRFLPAVEVIEKVEYVAENAKFDTVVSIDVANKERIGTPLKFLKEGVRLINIDHHVSNEKYGDINYVNDKASSASEIIFELLQAMNVDIDKMIAECIYCGLINDTGNFSYNNVGEKTFQIAALLKGTGIENEKISENLFANKSIARLKLLGYAIDNMVFDGERKFAYTFISREILDKYDARKEDTEGIVEAIRSYEACETALLLREDKKGSLKGSLRSKGKDVNKIAAVFGGGGHVKAAGFSSSLSYEEVINKIKENY